MVDPIRFTATVARVRTMADGGLRFEFDVGEEMTMQAAQLMECKRWGGVLEVECRASVKQNGSENGKVEAGRKRKSQRTTAEE
jgi:hypothetical protein